MPSDFLKIRLFLREGSHYTAAYGCPYTLRSQLECLLILTLGRFLFRRKFIEIWMHGVGFVYFLSSWLVFMFSFSVTLWLYLSYFFWAAVVFAEGWRWMAHLTYLLFEERQSLLVKSLFYYLDTLISRLDLASGCWRSWCTAWLNWWSSWLMMDHPPTLGSQ